jgi:hypothetical protein
MPVSVGSWKEFARGFHTDTDPKEGGMPVSVGSWKEFARCCTNPKEGGMPVSVGLFCSLLGLIRHPH